MTTTTEQSPYYTARELATKYRCSVSCISRWVRSKQMPAERIGRKWLFKRDKIAAWERDFRFVHDQI